MLFVPAETWVALGLIAGISIALLGLLTDPEFGWTVLSVMIGGFTMVLGYFFYQMFLIFPLFNIEVVAVMEVPINIGQMIIGAVVALPVARLVCRRFPYLNKQWQEA
jgi:hypothetical protein